MTNRRQSDPLHSRVELIWVHVDVPLRDLNARMASQGNKQAHIDALVG